MKDHSGRVSRVGKVSEMGFAEPYKENGAHEDWLGFLDFLGD